MVAESPEVQELFDLISKILPNAVKLNGTAFRSAGVKYANEADLISGNGASYNGGRWNPPGIKAIYGALDPIVAVKESYQEFIKYGIKKENIRPRVMAGVKLKVNCVLNLTDAKIRRKLGFLLHDLTQENWEAIQNSGEESWTQAIGRGAFLAGFEGLLAPSARDRSGKNVVIFPENLKSTSKLELMGKDELPPHPSEWPA